MTRYRVIVTPFAAENLRNAHAWLAAENPVAAAKWLAGIRAKILGLETLPHSHALAPESAAFDCDIRQALFGHATPWRIFFTIDGDIVQILHVRHGRRDDWLP